MVGAVGAARAKKVMRARLGLENMAGRPQQAGELMPYILAIIGAPITGYGMAADNPQQIIIGTMWLCTACIIMAIQKHGEKQ
ncbi:MULTISPECIES: hypothetical protein [Yersiniaceae]|uniref:Uncharacterized protein n=1 Tax=Nissabacter archeti TaxID=1917880 RepID=A0ABS5JCQ6_9GAMM|nr:MULTISPECIES: hypothetical protein [Yersiniaceae]MBS0967725.1 hypothetical protein [Nissabacter archeti]MDV5140838.1 hypothetical protein [Chimaeribacter arupi]